MYSKTESFRIFFISRQSTYHNWQLAYSQFRWSWWVFSGERSSPATSGSAESSDLQAPQSEPVSHSRAPLTSYCIFIAFNSFQNQNIFTFLYFNDDWKSVQIVFNFSAASSRTSSSSFSFSLSSLRLCPGVSSLFDVFLRYFCLFSVFLLWQFPDNFLSLTESTREKKTPSSDKISLLATNLSHVLEVEPRPPVQLEGRKGELVVQAGPPAGPPAGPGGWAEPEPDWGSWREGLGNDSRTWRLSSCTQDVLQYQHTISHCNSTIR